MRAMLLGSLVGDSSGVQIAILHQAFCSGHSSSKYISWQGHLLYCVLLLEHTVKYNCPTLQKTSVKTNSGEE